jgi:O-antigen ligase
VSSEALAESTVVGRLPWRWWSPAAFLAPLVAIVGVGAADGGFFATSFGWTALAFAWTTIVAISIIVPRWQTLDLVWLVTALALCLYTFGSAAWAGSTGDAVDEGLRTLVYLTGVAGALILLRQRDLERWLTGLVLGATGICFYSLATRLLPDHFQGFDSSDYRLFVPIGYWNALGVFAAIALLVALGIAAFGTNGPLRVVAAASTVVLAPTLYFTFSRGPWFALIAGTVVTLALSPLRLRLLGALGLLGIVPGLAVLLASGEPGLTERGSSLAAAAHDGHRLALAFLVLGIVQLAVAAVYVRQLSERRVSTHQRREVATALTLIVVVGLGAAFARYGSPVTIARHAYDSFVSAPAGGSNLNGRLFTLANDNRTVLWHAAWDDFRDNPLFGSGAGSYGAYWLAHRPSDYFVEDAHNLYLQTFAELGIVGFALLAAFLAVPLYAAAKARRRPLVAPAAGAYVAFLAHSAVDWDWQMPAVTLLALFVGAALVAVSRGHEPVPLPIPPNGRIAIGAAAAAAAALAFVGLIGHLALSASNAAILAGDGKKAAAEAAKAHSWAPWSAAALLDLGQGRALEGSHRAALGALRHAARIDKGDWQIWFDLAAVTSGAEHRADLARALKLNPYSPEIAQALQYEAQSKKS